MVNYKNKYFKYKLKYFKLSEIKDKQNNHNNQDNQNNQNNIIGEKFVKACNSKKKNYYIRLLYNIFR